MVARQSKVTRQLPEAATQLLERFSEPVRDVMLALRSRVLKVAPNAREIVADVGYTVALRYGPDDKSKSSFVYITGFSKHANLGFLNGATLNDPDGILEGDGAAMRHVKFESIGQIKRADWLDRYLNAAISATGFGSNMGDAQTEVRTRARKR